MTDIIFKATITQPASNVADLNFVDNVIAFKPISIISALPQCTFQAYSVTAVLSKLALVINADFQKLVAIPPFNPASSIEVSPAIGFKFAIEIKRIKSRIGDQYFDSVRLLSHFNRIEGNGAVYNQIGKQRGIKIGNSYPIEFTDADTVITYIADEEAFEGVSVGADINQRFIFGDYILPIDDNSFFLNSVKTNVVEYADDYGKSLSVRGKDWCFETRVKTFGNPVDAEQHSFENETLARFSLGEVSLDITGDYYTRGSDTTPTLSIAIAVKNSRYDFAEINWVISDARFNQFLSLKLSCSDGSFYLYVDGIQLDVNHQSFEAVVYDGNAGGYRNAPHTIESPVNYSKIQLRIFASLPTYQLFGRSIFNDMLKIGSTPALSEISSIESRPDFVSVNSIKTYRVYRSKKLMIDAPIGKKSPDAPEHYLTHYLPLGYGYSSHNYSLELKSIFGLDSIVVTKDYIELFFNPEVIVEPSLKFYFVSPLEVWYSVNLERLIGNDIMSLTAQNQAYSGDYDSNIAINKTNIKRSFNYPDGDIASGTPLGLAIEIINGVVKVKTYGAGYDNNGVSFPLESVTYVGGASSSKNFKFNTPYITTINDTENCVFNVDSLFCSEIVNVVDSPTISYERFTGIPFFIEQIGINTTKANYFTVVDEVREDGTIIKDIYNATRCDESLYYYAMFDFFLN
jgi:hypothetical protein